MIASSPVVRGFIGRVNELASLHDVRDHLELGRGAIVLVGGPAGIGKTRLVSEFCRSLAGRRAPLLLKAECREGGNSTFAPIHAIVRAIEPGAPARLHALADDARERDQFYHAVERILIDAAAQKPLLIYIDDLHWADPATLAFLAFIAPHVERERIAIVATYRDDALEEDSALARAFMRIARGHATRRIALRPLSDHHIRSLLDTHFAAGDAAAQDTARSIVSRAAGNPFYAEELLKSFLEGADGTALPVSIRSSVLARFERLDDDQRNVLRHAALLGRRFDPTMLATILDREPGSIANALHEARAQSLIVEERREATPLRFRHALTQETIASQLLGFEARPIHARVARILEALPDGDQRIGEIAYHWWKAENPVRTLVTNEAAGAAATAIHAHDDAAGYYERALSVATSPPDELRLAMLAGNAAANNGDHVRSIAHCERALALELGGGGNVANAVALIRKIVGRLTYDGREIEARTRIETFVREHRTNLSEVQTLTLEGYPILLMLGNGGAAAWLDRVRASDAATAATGYDAWLLTYLELNACAYVGDVAGTRAATQRLMPAEGPATIEETLSIAAIAVGAAFAGVDRDRTQADLARAHRALHANGLASMRKYISVGEAFNHYLHGDLAAARAAAYVALGESYDWHQRMNISIVGASIGLAASDATLVAFATDDSVLTMWRRDGLSHRTALTATGIAEHAIAAGRTDDAIVLLEKAVAALETPFATQLLLPLAARYVRATSARRNIAALLETVREDDRSGLATKTMVAAIFAMRDGDANAAALADAAAARYGELRWPLLRAQALDLTGRKHVAADERSAAPPLTERERALAELVALGHGNIAIAAHLGVSVKTVESHLTRIFAKLHLRSRAQLASYITSENGALRTPYSV